MRLLLLAALLISPLALAGHRYVIDQDFCEVRALLGKSVMESKLRGEDKGQARREVEAIRDTSPDNSWVRVVAPLTLTDLEGLYQTKRGYTSQQAYMDLHDTCRDLRGRIVSL